MYKVLREPNGVATVIVRDDGASFPLSVDNRDFRAFQEWNALQDAPLSLDQDLTMKVAFEATAATKAVESAALKVRSDVYEQKIKGSELEAFLKHKGLI